MDNQPLVSILINNYNYGRFLPDAIDSALAQTYPHKETIVVDDGSTDDSREIIARYGNRIHAVLKENGGQASAFNAGFMASRGAIICFLDADDIFLPHKVERIVDVFTHHPDVGSCFHALKLVEATGMALPRGTLTGMPGQHDFRSYIRKGRMPQIATATSGLCFRRSLLAQILPMPEAEGVSLHDNYLKFASVALGKVFFADERLAHQRIHGHNRYTLRNDRQLLRARNTILTSYWLRRRFPDLARFTDRLFAAGLHAYWQAGGIEARYRGIVATYLAAVSPLERLIIGLLVLYYWCLARGGMAQ